MNYLSASFSPKEHKRIFSKISIDDETGCWNWTGSLDEQGYGLLWFKRRTERIHRVMFAFFKHPIPRGSKETKLFQLDHLCMNRRCCNPDHLEIVNQRTNILRGTSPVAINSRKTHCKYGHPLSTTPSGKRACRICDSIRHKKRMQGDKREYWLKKQNEASKRFYWKNKH